LRDAPIAFDLACSLFTPLIKGVGVASEASKRLARNDRNEGIHTRRTPLIRPGCLTRIILMFPASACVRRVERLKPKSLPPFGLGNLAHSSVCKDSGICAFRGIKVVSVLQRFVLVLCTGMKIKRENNLVILGCCTYNNAVDNAVEKWQDRKSTKTNLCSS